MTWSYIQSLPIPGRTIMFPLCQADISTQVCSDMFQLFLSWDAGHMSHSLPSNRESCMCSWYTVGRKLVKIGKSSCETLLWKMADGE